MSCSYRCKDGRAAPSALVYAPFLATVGGLAGSLAGFTLWGPVAALVGGFIGIVACDVAARCLLSTREQQAKAKPDLPSEPSPTA